MTSFSPAERLLHDLGITEPDEIDVEVIAWAVGARVCYRSLAQGDARIVGVGDRAVITVDDRASRVRQRFSVAHELGHWHHHRGQRLICHGATACAVANDCEREADRYAADLLMPRSMFVPWIANASMSLALVEGAARSFRVSALAAALRLADVHAGQFALIIKEPDGRRWFRRSSALPTGWHVRLDAPPADGSDGRYTDARLSRKIPARSHFRGRGLHNLLVRREAMPLPSKQMLILTSAYASCSPRAVP